MTSSEFKKGIREALQSMGFVYRSKRFERQTPEVLTLLEFQKSDYEDQWFINVGIWLCALDPQPPSRVAGAHLYFRLDRLLPDLREHILMAGALDDPGQGSAYERLLGWIPNRVDQVLGRLQTAASIAGALDRGELTRGLVRHEARVYLQQVAGKGR